MMENIKWHNELGGCHGHSAVVWRDKRTDRATSDLIQAEFVRCFDDVTFHTAGAEIDGWPEGANYFMRTASGYLQNRPSCRSFFWMEPDCIPLKEGWLEDSGRIRARWTPFHGRSGAGREHSAPHVAGSGSTGTRSMRRQGKLTGRTRLPGTWLRDTRSFPNATSQS